MPDFIGGLAKGIEKSRGMIENAMNGVTSDLTITPRVMAAQGSYSGSAASSGDLISGINTALNTALAGGGAAGDIVIPVQIGVTFRVSKKWLNKFSAYKKLASITVGYLDMETMNIVNTQMYIDGYQVKLVSDTSYGSLWEVSFVLKEF